MPIGNNKDMLIRLQGDNSDIKRKLKETETAFDSMRSGVETAFKGVGIATAAATAAVVGLGAATKKIADLADKGDQFKDLEDSYKSMAESAGYAADVLLNDLKKATDGAISDAKLFALTNKAMTLDLEASGVKFTDLADVVKDFADATGKDAAGQIEVMTNAMATGRVTLLASQGVFVDAKKAVEDYAKEHGKLEKNLTETEKLQAKQIATYKALKQAIADLGPGTENAGDAAQALAASWQNVQDQFAAGVAESDDLKDAFKDLKRALDDIDWRQLGSDVADFMGIVVDATTAVVDVFNYLREARERYRNVVQDFLERDLPAELRGKGESFEAVLDGVEAALVGGSGKGGVTKALKEVAGESKKVKAEWAKWTQAGITAADTLETRFYDLGNALFNSLQGALDGDFNITGLANAVLQGFGGSIQQLGGLLGGGQSNIGPVANGGLYGEMLGGAGPAPSLIYGGIAGTAASGIRAIERLLEGRSVSFTDQLALAPVTGGFSLLANLPGLFNSGKDPDQLRRDSIRDTLRGTGLGDDLILRGIRGNIDVGRSDYNVGSGLGGQSVGLVSGLGSLFGGDETGRSQLTAMFANAVGEAENFNEALIQTQTLMQQLGLNAEQAKNELTQLFLDGEIGLEEYQRGMESFNLAAQDNLVGTGSVRDALNVLADATSTNRARLQGLRLTFVELAEIGVDSVAEIRDYFTERFGPDVGNVFAMLADAGISFANITSDQVGLIFNALQPILNVLETELPNAYKRAEKSAENFAKSAVSSANSAADALGRIGQLGGGGLITDVGTIQNLIRTGQSRTSSNKGVGING